VSLSISDVMLTDPISKFEYFRFFEG
jgi:hypothetical protein